MEVFSVDHPQGKTFYSFLFFGGGQEMDICHT
jgi:hypothetical protein